MWKIIKDKRGYSILHSVGKTRKEKKCELFLRNGVLEEVKTNDSMQRKR